MPTTKVHPLAVVDPAAQLGPNCIVHAFATIGPHVRMGADNVIHSHAVIDGWTEIGARNRIHPFAYVGGPPQHTGWRGATPYLAIGDNNDVREYATISGGAYRDTGTRVGSGNFIMAYAHIGHDCRIGDHVRMANAATLAGHVEVQDHAWLSGLTAVHQFVRIGAYSFVAGGAIVTQDVPPFCIVQGDRARLVGINQVGLKRGGFVQTDIARLRWAFRKLFLSSAALEDRLALVHDEFGEDHRVATLVSFLRCSKRGSITTLRRSAG